MAEGRKGTDSPGSPEDGMKRPQDDLEEKPRWLSRRTNSSGGDRGGVRTSRGRTEAELATYLPRDNLAPSASLQISISYSNFTGSYRSYPHSTDRSQFPKSRQLAPSHEPRNYLCSSLLCYTDYKPENHPSIFRYQRVSSNNTGIHCEGGPENRIQADSGFR